MELNELRYIEDGFYAGVCGFWCKGHQNKREFLTLAIKEWHKLEAEKFHCGIINKISECPIKLNQIKHKFFRSANEDDLLSGRAEDEAEFILFRFKNKDAEPLTLVKID